MKRKETRLERPLDQVFAAPSNVAVLRALRDCREGMSGRAVGRQAEVNHQACALALKRLERMGLVLRQGSGKTQFLRLNTEHFLIKEIILPSLAKERELMTLIRQEVSQALGPSALALVLFGSAAREEAVQGSDIDLLLLCPAQKKPRLQDQAREFASAFLRRYGVRLAPLVLTLREAQARHEKGDPLLRNILADGLDLGRRKLREVLG